MKFIELKDNDTIWYDHHYLKFARYVSKYTLPDKWSWKESQMSKVTASTLRYFSYIHISYQMYAWRRAV